MARTPHGKKKIDDADWSSLPVLVLWMIKDKLDIFDDMCVAAVCREWRSASLTYPKKQTIGDGTPWLMQQNKNVNSSLQDFITITKNKRITLELPEFSNSLVLSSKKGWLLLRRKNINVSKERLPDSVFLMNPLTKAKIEMPDVAETHQYFGSFSINAIGNPKCVVLISAGISCQVTLRTAYPGDLLWTKHSPLDRTFQFEGCRGLITIGEQIYYYNIWGKMIIYNIATQIWKELPGPRDEMGLNYIAEHDGKIIKLFADGDDDCTCYSISAYNDADTSWERVHTDEMSNTSWYVSRLHNCFCARDSGLKVLVLHPYYGGLLRCTRTIRGYSVLSHDLHDGEKKSLPQKALNFERMHRVNMNTDCNWASLPVLLLWMIKDKLDIFDNTSLHAICRDWRSASSNYPKKQSIGDGMQWIMQVSKNFDSSARDFLSISRKKKFTIDLPDFANALLLFSKQGWLLMVKKNFSEEKERLPDSVFLVNPFTKDKINMPDVAYARLKINVQHVTYSTIEYHGSFSTRNGYPERVVLLNDGFSSEMTLCTASPGDLSWTKHSFIDEPMQIDGRCGLVTNGEKLYYLNMKENMVIYDMATQELKTLPRSINEIGYTYIMEYEGKIIQLFCRSRDESYRGFYIYNDTSFSWEVLKMDEIKNRSWYLSRKASCFSGSAKGLKAFLLSPRYGGVRHGFGVVNGFDIVCHDFMDGSTQTLKLPFRIGSSAKWVDVG